LINALHDRNITLRAVVSKVVVGTGPRCAGHRGPWKNYKMLQINFNY